MLDIFHIDPSDARVQVFLPRAATGTADWQPWQKPRGISQVMIIGCGGGGGGGGGLTGATGSARGGGSGGGCAAINRALYPAIFLPDVLYVLPGQAGTPGAAAGAGGSGAVSRVAVIPSSTLTFAVFHVTGGGNGAAGTTTTNSGGLAGGTSSVANASWYASSLFLSMAGNAGGAGGSGAGLNAGAAITAFQSQVLCGGAGGGSTPTANTTAAGGDITAAGLLEVSRAGGAAGTNPGQDGVYSLSPFWSTGGAGGGSNGAAAQVGGAGGSAGYGSGGGGGGAGVTGGVGGRGGDGIVIIACW